MAPIRTGVIGVGHLGYHHARLYAALPEAELVGVADVDEGRRTRAANDFSVLAVGSVEELLALGIEAASVAAPTVLHHDIAISLIEHGVHVLVEKPMAATVNEAEAMTAAARTHQRILQVGHIERFNGAVLALCEALRKPRFIECHRLSPYPMRSTDVSVVLDLMIHDLDIVLALDGSGVIAMDAVGVPVFSKEEDIANVRLRFASGCVANLTSSRVSVEPMRKIRIFEENAYVSTSYTDQEVLVYRKKPGPVPEDVNPMTHISIDALPVKREEPLRLELASFLECVRENKRPLVSAEDGLRALRLAQDIVEYIRKHN